MILFMDIPTFLGIDYRVALLKTFYLVVIGISKKSGESYNSNIQKFVVKKVKSSHVSNRHTGFLVTIIELLRFLNRT